VEEERQLCPDGACVGIIDDGHCKVCGLAAGAPPPEVIVRVSPEFVHFGKRKRPRGLTALAVINFLFAARSGLALLGSFASPKPVDGLVASFLAVGGLGVLLEVITGVGWLRQRRVAGLIIANVWGGVSVVQAVLAYAVFHTGFVFVGCVYPAIALTLINGLYRRSFGPPAMTVLADPATGIAASRLPSTSPTSDR
jgi:hypothetical protein